MQFAFIAQIIDGTPEDRFVPHLKAEAQRAWELYTAGVFRSIHARKDVRGVVGMMEAVDLSEAQKAIESLPFVQMGVLKVDIIPLAPYTGHERLFDK
jgi:uncharacterized protein YciI